jgi:hypothetical protein
MADKGNKPKRDDSLNKKGCKHCPTCKKEVCEFYVCPTCENHKIVREKDKWVECICSIRSRIRYKLATFLPAPPSTPGLDKKIKGAMALLETTNKLFIDGIKANYYKTFFVSLLSKTGLIDDFKVINTNFLIDLYLSKVEDMSMYDIHNKTIVILHGLPDTGNRMELNIISMFLEIHNKKRVIIHSRSKDPSRLKFLLNEKGFKSI